jgi:predicted transcriptional regulator
MDEIPEATAMQDRRTPLNFACDHENRQKLDTLAWEDNTSRSAIIRSALSAYFAARERQRRKLGLEDAAARSDDD